MSRHERWRAWLGRGAAAVLLASLGAVGGGCQGRTMALLDNAQGTPRQGGVRAGVVNLTDRDLAPLDAWIGTRNSQWILGDEVEVVASREYFAQELTVNATLGLVERHDRGTPDEMTVTLTYVGAPGSASVTTNPRVLIGTGLTITARKRLIVRLVRTRDADVPVRLRVTATGDASRGRKEEVLERAPQLVIGGAIRRAGGAWRWQPIGGGA